MYFSFFPFSLSLFFFKNFHFPVGLAGMTAEIGAALYYTQVEVPFLTERQWRLSSTGAKGHSTRYSRGGAISASGPPPPPSILLDVFFGWRLPGTFPADFFFKTQAWPPAARPSVNLIDPFPRLIVASQERHLKRWLLNQFFTFHHYFANVMLFP